MTLTGLVDLFCTDPTLSASIDDARTRRLPALDLTSPPSMRPFVAAALAASSARGGGDRPVLVVTSTYREAEDVTAALQSLMGEDTVAYYPAWETLPHERLSPRSDTVGRRLAVLRRLATPSCRRRRSSSRPSAASCSRRSRAWPTCCRSASSPVRTTTSGS